MRQKSIFITGAASGIGLATALLFLKKGWFVGGYDIDEKGLTSLQDQLQENGTTACLDVTDKSAFDDAISSFSKHTDGHMDIMFNNAGIALGGFFDEIPFEKIMLMLNINLIGVVNGAYAAIPLLKNTENSLCLTTASSAAIFGTPRMAVYSATKHAVKGLTEALSVELARYGSRAADLLPGIIDTPLWKGEHFSGGKSIATFEAIPKRNVNHTDASRTLDPAEVAKSAWQAYQGTKLHWYIPAELEEQDKAKLHSIEAIRDQKIAEILQ